MKSPGSLLRGDLSFAVSSVKNVPANDRCQRQLADQALHRLLDHVDGELAEAVRIKGCQRGHSGKLHRANYERKPRGGPTWEKRHSFCCDQEGCRRRHTPPSVRFLGRKVYVGFVVVLMTAMNQGLKPSRVQGLCAVLPTIERRTLERWRQWWLKTFAAGPFWKDARARFVPPLSEAHLPVSLCERFGLSQRNGLVELLRFLSPITTVSPGKDAGM